MGTQMKNICELIGHTILCDLPYESTAEVEVRQISPNCQYAKLLVYDSCRWFDIAMIKVLDDLGTKRHIPIPRAHR